MRREFLVGEPAEPLETRVAGEAAPQRRDLGSVADDLQAHVTGEARERLEQDGEPLAVFGPADEEHGRHGCRGRRGVGETSGVDGVREDRDVAGPGRGPQGRAATSETATRSSRWRTTRRRACP